MNEFILLSATAAATLRAATTFAKHWRIKGRFCDQYRRLLLRPQAKRRAKALKMAPKPKQREQTALLAKPH